MISRQHPYFNVKTSPLREYEQHELLNINENDLKLLDLSNYGVGPGSVESARSSNTDQSSSENLSLVPITHSTSLTPYSKNNASCSSNNSQLELVDELICAVCGDSASGIHYSVVSCNGCKTFFRRTLVTGRTFTCKNNGNCLFDKDKRCSCRACRWQKCIDAGMDHKAIQYTPSANLTLSIARKRFQRSLRNPAARQNVQFLQSEQEVILHSIDQVLHLDEKFDRLRCSSFFNYDPNIRLQDLISRPSSLADANKYPLVEKWPVRPNTLSFVDDLKEIKKLGLKFWFYMDLYLSVEYIKTLPVFQQLSTQDKCLLLFDTALKDQYMSTSYFSFTKRAEEVIVYPDNSVPFMHKDNLFELEKLIRRGVVPEMVQLKPDQIQFSLLRAICALTANNLSEEGQELVAKECSKYTTSLLGYLQNKHGVQMGTKAFGESMSFLTALVFKIKNNYDYYTYKRFVLQIPAPSTLFIELMTKRTIVPKRQ